MAEGGIDFVELFKLVGSFGGIASAGFLIYDRIFRNSPLVYFAPGDSTAVLCIKNVAKETVVIEEVGIAPPILALACANDLLSPSQARALAWYPSINDATAMRTFIALDPEKERSFAIKRSADFENALDGQMVRIRVKWRNTRKPLPFYRSVWLWASVKEIRELRYAALANPRLKGK